jgi:hypothetical protein
MIANWTRSPFFNANQERPINFTVVLKGRRLTADESEWFPQSVITMY